MNVRKCANCGNKVFTVIDGKIFMCDHCSTRIIDEHRLRGLIYKIFLKYRRKV